MIGMNKAKSHHDIPRYRGRKWIQPDLPEQAQPWLSGSRQSVGKERSDHRALHKELKRALGRGDWKWPKKHLCFVSDLHADADAFWASLVASGGIRKTGADDADFELTDIGRHARFIIGGDCFDKGPSNLRLLGGIRRLMKAGADVRLLAGNHDMRMMLGIRMAGQPRDPHTEHFFVRMGSKAIPFLKEVYARYLDGRHALRGVPTKRECRRLLYPSQRWFRDFPLMAGWIMPDAVIEKEMRRMRAKVDSFEQDCEAAGLSLRMVYAAARHWQRLFLHPKGEYAWFFRDIKLARREGSFLFIHAGFDDRTARIVHDRGVGHLNRLFRMQLEQDPCDFYYGHIANAIRTKYRPVDRPLTRHGVELIRDRHIHAVVHGHRNVLNGQRIMLRKGLIHFECDTTLDRHSRRKEGLKGHGAAATLFHPRGRVIGVCSDYPYVKVFEPSQVD